ncbi:hypothetical protein ACFYV7_30405 [Nocardia suismassiliense]|uniref:ATP-binding protein n=1 Tax=Nocardia suismassiliense TaxID=2077092 RepID=A0ABW6R0V2_9NOCA
MESISEPTATDGDRLPSPFDDLIRDRVGPDFVERQWLRDRVTAEAEANQYVLVTGEPGAGKTSLLAGLSRAHPEWLGYFIRRDSRMPSAGGDIQSFLLSIGHQLARRRPELFEPERLSVVVRQQIETVAHGGRAIGIRIEDLTVSPFHRTAALEVEQRVGEVSGTVTGIEIGYAALEPRLLEPDNLAHLALLAPAEVLRTVDPTARIVILLDALDELASDHAPPSLMRWLTEGPELPANVRVLMTSRPHAGLGQLRSARAGQLGEVVIDPSAPQVADDLLGYAKRVLGTEPIVAAVHAQGALLDQFQRAVVGRAAGNFLYLSTYARALTDTVADDAPRTARLLQVAGLPPDLDGLYTYFIDTLRTDLTRLGSLEIRDPTSAGDTLTPAWEGVGQPMLGVLAVAGEPVTVEELSALAGIRVWPRSVRNVLARLRWLLDVRDDRVAFYHSSIGEFLTSEPTHRQRPEYAVDPAEWHERIVRHYRGGAASWAAVDWDSVDRYGLIHLGRHVVGSRAAVAAEVAELVCPGLRRAVRTSIGNDRHFLGLVDLAADRVLETASPATGLPTILYLGVVRRQVLRSVHDVVPAVLGLLARLGRTEAAVEHVLAMPPSYQQFQGIHEIVQHTPQSAGDPRLRNLLVESALSVPKSEVGTLQPDQYPLRWAATTIAPHDLDRALLLWERARRPDSGWREDHPPDPLYRAAAATKGIREARALVAAIQTDRAGDYLDLAARADAEDLPELLHLAESSLTDAGTAGRLHCHARLFNAWLPREPARADRHRAELLAQVERGSDDAGGLAHGLVDAATELADTDRATAEHLLRRLSTVVLNGLTADAFLRAARLWARWGTVLECGRLLNLLYQWNNTVGSRVRHASVIAEFDLAGGFGIIEDAHAAIPAHRPDLDVLGRIKREGDLRSVALAFAEFDLGRALLVARELPDTSWSRMGTDRYSVVALLAHRHLDAGDTAQATALLHECLDQAGEDRPLVDAVASVAFHRADDEWPESPGAWEFAFTYMYNHIGDWETRCRTRFYRSPGDVIRALTPGPGLVGNPYSWARTVRVLAQHIARHELPRAITLVDALADDAERVVGLATMFQFAASVAVDSSDETANRLWAEFGTALNRMPRYEWLFDRGRDEIEASPFAYVRPDHRTRFDAACWLIPYEADSAMALLSESGARYLTDAFALVFGYQGSSGYMISTVRGRRPFPPYRQLHAAALSAPAARSEFDEPLWSIGCAMAWVHEHLIISSTGQPTLPAPMPQISDPLYAAVVDLLFHPPGRPPDRDFTDRVRELMTGDRLPAVAGLLAFAATLRPPGDALLRELAMEVLVEARDRDPATRVVTLLQFAVSPTFGALVDPVDLLADTDGLDPSPWERLVHNEVSTQLFPLLLHRAPSFALRRLYAALRDNWASAMALLEHAAEPLLEAIGVDVVGVLHNEIRRAMACVSDDGTAPALVDGVDLGTAAAGSAH